MGVVLYVDGTLERRKPIYIPFVLLNRMPIKQLATYFIIASTYISLINADFHASVRRSYQLFHPN